IDLRQNSQTVFNVTQGAPNSGQFVWNVPASLPLGTYTTRITRGTAFDDSNAPFTVTSALSIYYVNDSTMAAGDWTTAPGTDANNGLTPATPKASIRSLLQAYSLQDGDIIRVDAGIYTLGSNIVITQVDSGVTLVGYTN